MKLVAESLNEAIGVKDLVRMQDIKTKANGDHAKELSLATTQAKIIQDAGKAQARAEAAEQVFGPGNDITPIFHDRAVELGGSGVRSKASADVLAPVVGPVGKGEKLERKFKTQYLLPSERIAGANAEKKPAGSTFGSGGGGGGFSRGNSEIFKGLGIGRFSEAGATEIGGKRLSSASISPIGRVNFGTGECEYFNVHDTYKGSTAEIWKDNSGHFKVVFTSGDKPLGKLEDYREFRNDQTWKSISGGRHGGYWTLKDYVPEAELKELIRVYGGSLPGYCYK
jgi:hypothetical protein